MKPVISLLIVCCAASVYGESPLPSYLSEQPQGFLVRLTNGKKILLRNNPVNNEKRLIYRYTPSDLEPHLVLFSISQYEGVYAMWVNRDTGKIAPIASFPFFSPSRKRFVLLSAGDDDNNNYGDCLLEVWKRVKHNVAREYSLRCTEQWFLTGHPLWETDEIIRFEKKIRDVGDSRIKQTVRLTFDGKQWIEKN